MRTKKKCLLFFAFIPEGCEFNALAGLLTYSLFAGLPIIPLNDSGTGWAKSDSLSESIELTAAGTVPDSHRIPFSSPCPESDAANHCRVKNRNFFFHRGRLPGGYQLQGKK